MFYETEGTGSIIGKVVNYTCIPYQRVLGSFCHCLTRLWKIMVHFLPNYANLAEYYHWIAFVTASYIFKLYKRLFATIVVSHENPHTNHWFTIALLSFKKTRPHWKYYHVQKSNRVKLFYFPTHTSIRQISGYNRISF